MTIHILRHGKTLANEKKLYCGHTDLPLSENGIAELVALKNQDIYPPAADIFFTSGFARTYQTIDILYPQAGNKSAAQPVVGANSVRPVHIHACTAAILEGTAGEQSSPLRCTPLPQTIIVPALSEYNFGQFEMKSYEDLKHQADYQAWITDETGDVLCPGGESKNQVRKRVLEGYAQVIDTMQQAGHSSVIVVCHGGTIVFVMEHLFPNTKNFYEWQPQPGRGYSIFCSGEEPATYKPI